MTSGPHTILCPEPTGAAILYALYAADQCFHMNVQRCWLCLQGRYCRIGRRIHQSVDGASISSDLAVAIQFSRRDGGSHLIAAWQLR